jgi:hypothetical protein
VQAKGLRKRGQGNGVVDVEEVAEDLVHQLQLRLRVTLRKQPTKVQMRRRLLLRKQKRILDHEDLLLGEGVNLVEGTPRVKKLLIGRRK